MTYSAIVHYFSDSLIKSQSLNTEINWNNFYREIWGEELISCIRIDENCRDQRIGIDRRLNLRNGKQITIDEKIRGADYGDILLEEWSVVKGYNPHSKTWARAEKIGWALDPIKQCDYLAYAIPSAQKCYLLPYELLRAATRSSIEAWKKTPGVFYPKAVKNTGYYTINIAVPWPLVRAAIDAEMERQYQGKITPQIDFTNAHKVGKQLEIWGNLAPLSS